MRLFLKSRTRPALCTSAFREILTDTSEKNIDEPVNELNVETFINDTRKKSLQIMAKLADEPIASLHGPNQ